MNDFNENFVCSLPVDEEKYLGRECPKCNKYFKIMPGTGLKEVSKSYCPYCEYKADQQDFTTEDQVKYAHSIAEKKIFDKIDKEMKGLERSFKGGLLNIDIKVNTGESSPIYHYDEKKLETYIECPQCTLKYAVSGEFKICPDCGNSNVS